MTRAEIIAALSAITRELTENRITIVHSIIDMDRNVIAEYRRTVRTPRDARTGASHSGG